MKKLLLSLMTITTLSSYANADDYLYMDYSSYNDNGGITTHRFFKVKAPKKAENSVGCTFSFEGLDEGTLEEGTTSLLVAVQKSEDNFSLIVNEDSLDEDTGLNQSSGSIDIRSEFSQLFTSFSSGDGYVFSGITAGSSTMVSAGLRAMSEGERDQFPDGDLTQAFDLSKSNYKKVIEGEGTAYQTILKVECEEEILD